MSDPIDTYLADAWTDVEDFFPSPMNKDEALRGDRYMRRCADARANGNDAKATELPDDLPFPMPRPDEVPLPKPPHTKPK